MEIVIPSTSYFRFANPFCKQSALHSLQSLVFEKKSEESEKHDYDENKD